MVKALTQLLPLRHVFLPVHSGHPPFSILPRCLLYLHFLPKLAHVDPPNTRAANCRLLRMYDATPSCAPKSVDSTPPNAYTQYFGTIRQFYLKASAYLVFRDCSWAEVTVVQFPANIFHRRVKWVIIPIICGQYTRFPPCIMGV